MSTVLIRDAKLSDAPRLLEIYSYYVKTTAITFEYDVPTLEQFREFPANTEYFVLEPNIRKVEDVGWRYLAQHLDVLLPPELLDAIDPVPFGNHAMREEQGCFTSKGYLTLSGDEWVHKREKQTEKKPSIKERLEQSRKECANQNKAQTHRETPAPER